MKQLLIILLVAFSSCAVTDVTLVKEDNFDNTGNIMWGQGQPWGLYHPRYLDTYWVLPTQAQGHAYFVPEHKPKEFDGVTIPYATGKMYSFHEQKYGYWEAKVLINQAPNLRSAFWMWSGDPYVEIDIFEFDSFSSRQKMNVHWGERVDHKSQQIGPINRKTLKPGQWQVFGFLWTPKKMVWYVDGKVVKRVWCGAVLKWARENDTEVWTVLSQNMLGPLNDIKKGSMIVDYLRIYELKQ